MATEDDRLARAAELERQAYEAFAGGDADRSRRLADDSLGLARRAGDPEAIVRALAAHMRLALRARDFPTVEQLAEESEQLAGRADDPRPLRRLPLHMRAEAARMQGDTGTARSLYDASIALNRSLGNEAMVTVELGNKGWAEIDDGRLATAESLFRESLDRTGADDAYGAAFCLLGLARVELERGSEHGVELLGAAERILADAGRRWDPAEEDAYERTVALAEAVAGPRLPELRARTTP